MYLVITPFVHQSVHLPQWSSNYSITAPVCSSASNTELVITQSGDQYVLRLKHWSSNYSIRAPARSSAPKSKVAPLRRQYALLPNTGLANGSAPLTSKHAVYTYITHTNKSVGRDSSGGIATRYELESWWSRDFLQPYRPALGPTQPPVRTMGTGSFPR
jgi:hypothetical protein